MECFCLHPKKHHNHKELLKDMFYFQIYSNVWDKTVLGYSITISWSVKLLIEKPSLGKMPVGARQDFWVPLTPGCLIHTNNSAAEDMQNLTEMDEWNPGPAGISLCLKAWMPGLRPGFYCDSLCSTLSTPPGIKEVLSFLSKWSFGGPLIRSECHPTDTTIL